MPVVFAQGSEEASRCAELLDSMDIPSLIGADLGAEGTVFGQAGMPVLVTREFHDRACEVLATRAAETGFDWQDIDSPLGEDDEDDDEDDFDHDEDEDDPDPDDDCDDYDDQDE